MLTASDAPSDALRFTAPDGKVYAWRAPATREQLAWQFDTFFGWKLAPTPHPDCVSKGHTAPLDVAWSFYSGRDYRTGRREPISVLRGARGLAGKSVINAGVSTLEGLASLSSVVLGGSYEQSKRIHELAGSVWDRNVLMEGRELHTPFRLLMDEPTGSETKFRSGATRRVLTASRRAVRSKHPHRARLDEVDEMTLDVYESAQGQTLTDDDELRPTHTSLSSTLQHVNGTFQTVLERAAARQWPIYEVCVARGTMVTTPIGPVSIERLRPGDEVMTYDDVTGTWHREIVSDVWSNGPRRSVYVRHDAGTLRCTSDHRVWTDRGWVRAGDLQPGDLLTLWPESGAQRGAQPDGTVQRVPDQFVQGRRRLACLSALWRAQRSTSARLHDLLARRGTEGPRLYTESGRPPVSSASHTATTEDRAARRVAADGARPAIQDECPDRPFRRGLPRWLSIGSRGLRSLLARFLLPRESDARSGAGDRATCGWVRRDNPVGGDGASLVATAAVQSVEDAGVIDVWDLTVPQHHAFVADGVVVHNCYRESLKENGGWLDPVQVAHKKREVSDEMWQTEYELGEPSLTGRIFRQDHVDGLFNRQYGTFEGRPGEVVRMACCSRGKSPIDGVLTQAHDRPHCSQHRYAVGIDWAATQDWLIIAVYRTDVSPWWLVHWERMERIADGGPDWPERIARARDVINEHGGGQAAAHDATGMGGRMADQWLDLDDLRAVQMGGTVRDALFSDYIVSVQRGEMTGPRITWAYDSHRYLTREMVATGRDHKKHTPDDVVAGALARSTSSRLVFDAWDASSGAGAGRADALRDSAYTDDDLTDDEADATYSFESGW